MDPITAEDREYLILKTIENSEGIGFNGLHKKTGIPKKTLSKYLKDLDDKNVITKKKPGGKQNNRVRYVVNFSEDVKDAIKHNLKQISQYNKDYAVGKIRKTNTFPHYLQELAAEYYQNMMSYLFHSIPQYKFGVKRIEELLKEEKKRLDKQFNDKDKARLWNDCQDVQIEITSSANNSIYYAANRNNYRTRDEIIIDCFNPRKLDMVSQEERMNRLKKQGLIGNFFVDKYRADYIKDKKIKKLFIELANEYDELSKRLSTIKYRLAGITGAYPYEPKNADEVFEF